MTQEKRSIDAATSRLIHDLVDLQQTAFAAMTEADCIRRGGLTEDQVQNNLRELCANTASLIVGIEALALDLGIELPEAE